MSTTPYLDDLQDVSISSPVRNNTLRYSGLDWANGNPPITEDPLRKSGEWYPLNASDYSTGIITDGLTANGTITRSTDSFGRKTRSETMTTTANPAGLTQTVARYRREFDYIAIFSVVLVYQILGISLVFNPQPRRR